MPTICYVTKRFNAKTQAIIDAANQIIDEYEAEGFSLTLRQLYYQFVARGLLPNTQRSYSSLGDIISNARLAGAIDWEAIEDRTRFLRSLSTWHSPSSILGACPHNYRIDMWEGQQYRPEVWIEKDALIGVIEGKCEELRVPCFSCRGYVSQSEMWGAGQRMQTHRVNGQTPLVIHLGDHDPSGIDMSRDIEERLSMFIRDPDEEDDGEEPIAPPRVIRIALTMAQVKQYNPPPNPAKCTDARFRDYARRHGMSSWELDALEPSVLCDLVEQEILKVRDERLWKSMLDKELDGRNRLHEIASNEQKRENEAFNEAVKKHNEKMSEEKR